MADAARIAADDEIEIVPVNGLAGAPDAASES
jgi:hypothetical protein